jgi:thiaminase
MNEATDNPSIPFFGTQAYVDYMYKMFAIASPGIAASSFIACPWSYAGRDIGGVNCGRRFAESLAKYYGAKKEVVELWAYDMDSAEWHMELIKMLKDMINREAKQGGKDAQTRMRDAFRRNSEFEYIFWDQVYRYELTEKKVTKIYLP